VGGEFLLKLNITPRPIANKYREGKLQRTLKRELKDLKPSTGKGSGKTRRGTFSCLKLMDLIGSSCAFVQPVFQASEAVAVHLYQAPCMAELGVKKVFN